MTARKRAKAAFRASGELLSQIENRAAIGLALVALDGSFLRVNPALRTLTGYSNDELLGSSYPKLAHWEELDALVTHFDQTREGVTAEHELETRLVRKDGTVVWSSITLSLVRDNATKSSYFIAQFQDICTRKTAQILAAQGQQAALSAAAAESRFLATMSHELRTPMNGIIGTLELLSLSDLTAEQTDFVTVVRESSSSLLRVLNDILDFSKIMAGKLALVTAGFDLRYEIASVASLFASSAKAKGVSLIARVEADVPAVLEGDAGRLRQILINLVGNGVKFTPARGSVELSVTAELHDATGTTVRFSVTDTGIGIAPDAKCRLFAPFSQIDDSTTRTHGGTGLGLAICKLLVDLMGGQIGVSSEKEGGSSFWFALPLPRGVAAPSSDAELHSRATGGSTEKLPRSEKLLLAEDNEVNARLAVRQLAQLGFDLTVVPNGQKAVEALENTHFDLVFMDCHMPIMDGFTATTFIRNLQSPALARVPIVAMTANAQAHDRLECLSAGMDDYISKPVTLSLLRSVLERWLPSNN